MGVATASFNTIHQHGGDHRFPEHGGDNRFNNNNINSMFSLSPYWLKLVDSPKLALLAVSVVSLARWHHADPVALHRRLPVRG